MCPCCRRVPALFQKDADHLLRLFRVFSESGGAVDRDVGLAVQECMSLLAPAYQEVAVQKSLLLEAALLENIYSVRTPEAVCVCMSLWWATFDIRIPKGPILLLCGRSENSVLGLPLAF